MAFGLRRASLILRPDASETRPCDAALWPAGGAWASPASHPESGIDAEERDGGFTLLQEVNSDHPVGRLLIMVVMALNSTPVKHSMVG
jgi:hypothetical protein